jgi:hypothetical protein
MPILDLTYLGDGGIIIHSGSQQLSGAEPYVYLVHVF